MGNQKKIPLNEIGNVPAKPHGTDNGIEPVMEKFLSNPVNLLTSMELAMYLEERGQSDLPVEDWIRKHFGLDYAIWMEIRRKGKSLSPEMLAKAIRRLRDGD